MKVSRIQYQNPYFQGQLTITDPNGQKKVFQTTKEEDKHLEDVFDKCYFQNSCHGYVPVEKLRDYEQIMNEKYEMNIPKRSDSLEKPVEAFVRGKFYIINAPGDYKITHELYNNRLSNDGDYSTTEIEAEDTHS